MTARGMMTDRQRGEIVAAMVEAIPDLTSSEGQAIFGMLGGGGGSGNFVVTMRAILDRFSIRVVKQRENDGVNWWRANIVAAMVEAIPDLTSLQAEAIISNKESFVAEIGERVFHNAQVPGPRAGA